MTDVIKNLEDRLKPVPKSRRLMLKRKKSLDKWLKAMAANPAYEKEEKERMYAMDVSMYNCIEELLLEKRNMDVFNEANAWLQSSIKNPARYRRYITAFNTQEMIEITEGMLGVKAEKPSIKLTAELRSKAKYVVLKKEISIGEMPMDMIPEIIAHEYAHHLELASVAQFAWEKYIILTEGFAYNAGRCAAVEYGWMHNMPGLRRYALENIAARMRESCSILKKLNRMHVFNPDKTQLIDYGVAAFIVAEARHGKTIYREILRSANPAGYLIKQLE